MYVKRGLSKGSLLVVAVMFMFSMLFAGGVAALQTPPDLIHKKCYSKDVSVTACNETGQDGAISSHQKKNMLKRLSGMPLSFVENRGQVSEKVKYYARQHGVTVYFTAGEIVFDFIREKEKKAAGKERDRLSRFAEGKRANREYERQVVRMKLKGSNMAPPITGSSKRAETYNYFKGNDKSKWRSNVPAYGEVYYKDVYAGIDLRFYAKNGELEYDFIAHPGADVGKIDVAFDGIESMKVAEGGDLVIKTAFGEMRHKAPHVYQMQDGRKKELAGGFSISKDKSGYGFALASHDTRYALLIDPVIEYGTYLGGAGSDFANGVAVDSSKRMYIIGETVSTDFPTVHAEQSSSGGNSDVFVTKLSADGSSVIYSTYLGGTGNDYGYSIAADSSGNAYITGVTYSSNFPVSNAYQPSSAGGGADAFVAKLSSDGSSLSYSTYLGGGNSDIAYGIAVDSSGAAYVAGRTYSDDFPTTESAYQPTFRGEAGKLGDGFIFKFSADGQSAVYSTYLGGDKDDIIYAVAIDGSGNAYVTGETKSVGTFPTTEGAYQTTHGGGWKDSFVTKLNSAGTALVYSTYLGGGGYDTGFAITVDSSGVAYVAGTTASSNFGVTSDAHQTSFKGDLDGFLFILSADGTGAHYSTYLGGTGYNYAYGVAVDGSGNAYVAGQTSASDFPVKNAYQSSLSGSQDIVLFKVNSLNSVVYSTYLGGSGEDMGFGIAVDGSKNVYVAGKTSSANLPVVDAIYSKSGGYDAFVIKISPYSSVTAGAAGTGTGSVSSSVSGISYSYPTTSTKTADFSETASLALTATAGSGSIASWGTTCATAGGSASGSTSAAVCTFTSLYASRSVTATFSLIVNGSCGTSGGQTTTTAPTANLCAKGTASEVTTNAGTFTWTCAGSNTGTDANCSATRAYTATPSVVTGSGHGTISPDTAQAVVYNTTKDFTVTPSAGYISSMAGTCSGSLSGTTYTTNAITADCTVVANFLEIVNGSCGTSGGQTTTTTAPTANLCAKGTASEVTTNAGTFTWTCAGSNTGSDASCSATRAYTATPSVVTGSGHGTISPDTAQAVAYNTTKGFTVSPSTGYITSMSGTCGGSLSGTTYTTNAITANCTVIANFLEIVNGSCGTSGGQTTTAAPTANLCSVGTASAVTSNAGTFTWTCSGSNTGSDASCSATRAYTATPSVVTGSGHGAISPGAAQAVAYNTTKDFMVTPEIGYTASVTGTCGGSLVGTTYTTNAVTANCTVIASFTINRYVLTINKTGTGSGTVSGAGTYNYSSTAIVTATASTGSTFTGWSGDCSGTSSATTVTMTGAKTCAAKFTLNKYMVTVKSNGAGAGRIASTPAGISYTYIGKNKSGKAAFNHGSKVILTAIAGIRSATWGGTCKSAGGAERGNGTTKASCTFSKLTAAKTVTVKFENNHGD
jgi:uncharacterized repeat protein (TIGR02543 family)